ncbi:hypothetical protein [Vibrio penaeicida]|uniref:hypothetical protein n=1 Tax=Vibrio penaeicida TaxID=104609 RepID=UPI001CC64C25|nr:hypothetical protein [Vibrio penaeicida]
MLKPAEILLKEIEENARIELASDYLQALSSFHDSEYILETLPELKCVAGNIIGELIDKTAPLPIVDIVALHYYQTLNNAQESCERMYRDLAIEHYRSGKLYAYNKVIEYVDPYYKELPERLTDKHYKLAIEWLHVEPEQVIFDHMEESFKMVFEHMPTSLFKDLWVHDALLFDNPKDELLLPIYANKLYEEVLSHFGLNLQEDNQRVVIACIQDQHVVDNARLTVQQRMQE